MDSEWRKEAILKEIECFRELLSLGDSKNQKAHSCEAYEAMILNDDAVKGVHYEEVLKLYNDLMTLEHSVAFLHKVTSSIESLSKHLFRVGFAKTCEEAKSVGCFL